MSLRLHIACGALALALLPLPAAAALVPPPGFTAAVQIDEDEERECPQVPRPFTEPLDFPSRYEGSDAARDDANAKATRIYKQKTADINNFEKGFSKIVDQYVKEGQPAQLDCALGWLRSWSQAQALLGDAKTHTGMSMRKWALGSIAAAYLRLKFSSSQPLAPHAGTVRQAEAWLGLLGDRVMREWTGAPIERFNNHEYWAAWAAMATAVALDRQDLFDWSVAAFRRAAGQIDAEGYLPNELARETRALQYHNYSLPPLTMIVAFAKANGVDLRQENGGALERLVRRTLAGVDDPAIFKDKTGKKQVKEGTDEASKFSWLEPYCWAYGCSGALAQRLEQLRPLKTYRLGGDVTALFAPTPGAAAAPAAVLASSLQ